MIGVIPFKGAAPLAIDADWLALWSGGFPDERLCGTMLADDHLAPRIGESILKHAEVRGDIGIRPSGESGAQLKTFATMPRKQLVQMLGMLWKAPVLSSVLPNPIARVRYRMDSRAKIDAVLAYRNHAPATVVGPLDHDHDFAAEGTLCLYAWIAQFEPCLQDRLLLTLPFCEGTLDARSERRALTARLLSDDATLGMIAP